MSDLPTLEDQIFTVLCVCFSLSPASPEAAYRLRRAYPADETLPQPPRNRDVCYFSLSPESAPDPQPLTVLRNDPAKDVWYQTVPLALRLYFYGPHAPDDALRIRALLFTDDIRARLRSSGLIPIPSPPPPTYIPEIEGTLWRPHATLTVSLRSLRSLETPATSVTVPPDLVITNNSPGSDSPR